MKDLACNYIWKVPALTWSVLWNDLFKHKNKAEAVIANMLYSRFFKHVVSHRGWASFAPKMLTRSRYKALLSLSNVLEMKYFAFLTSGFK
jgi:hypothetical protein